jgi:hypothetical protein
MKEVDRKARNAQRLQTLFPTFAARLSRVIVRLEAQDIRPRIQDAWRSPEDQKKAFDTGHSKLLFGFHNVTGEGGRPEGLAVDLLDDDAPLDVRKPYVLKLAAAAQAESLVTGVRWGVPKKLIDAIDAAIAGQDWEAPVKIGWDPLHVEPTGITVAEARAGRRPQ